MELARLLIPAQKFSSSMMAFLVKKPNQRTKNVTNKQNVKTVNEM